MFSRRTEWDLTLNKLTLACQEMRRKGKAILDLTVSNPTEVGIDHDGEAILSALSNPEVLHYDPDPKGFRGAREAVAQYYSRHIPAGHGLDPDSLVLTTSTSEAYSFVFRLLTDPCDELLVPKPSYPLFDFLADLQDVKLAAYPLFYDNGWHVDFASLAGAVNDKTRAVVVVHPNNPTGSYVSKPELEQLNALCLRHRLSIIADEVFLDYWLDSPSQTSGSRNEERMRNSSRWGRDRPFSFAANREVLTFTLSGLSKISALPQMKLAWIAVSGPEQASVAARQRLEIIADTYLSLNAPVQLATRRFLDQRHKIQAQLISRIRENLSELERQVAAQNTCTRLELEGGWNVILRVPAIGSEHLAIELLQQRSVLVHPGHFYDFQNDGYLVLSLITPAKEFGEGISLLLEFVNRSS